MSEQIRRANNATRALALLQAKGPAGTTNVELLEVAGYRYGGRVHELRRDWHIETQPAGGGLVRYVLHGPHRPGQQTLWQEGA